MAAATIRFQRRRDWRDQAGPPAHVNSLNAVVLPRYTLAYKQMPAPTTMHADNRLRSGHAPPERSLG